MRILLGSSHLGRDGQISVVCFCFLLRLVWCVWVFDFGLFFFLKVKVSEDESAVFDA